MYLACFFDEVIFVSNSFPESPMWLLANHKYERAEAALRQMAKWNGVKIKGPLLAQLKVSKY